MHPPAASGLYGRLGRATLVLRRPKSREQACGIRDEQLEMLAMLRHLEDCDLAGNQLAHVEYVGPHRARRSDAAQHSLAPLPTKP
jgi:hypothetical protein